MNILLVTGTYKPSVNGVAISTEILARNLIKMGHSVLVLAPINNENKDFRKEVLRYPSLPNPIIVDYPIPLLPITPKIFSKIYEFNPDIVHVHHTFHIGFFAKIISDIFGAPLVFTYHTKHDYYAEQYFKFLPKDLRQKFISNTVIDFSKKSDLVIAPSEEIKKYLNKHKVLNVVTIPSIVDDVLKVNKSKKTIREKLNIPINKKILLYVGRLAKEKQIELAIRSMQKIPTDFHLVVCGSGPLESKIKRLVKQLNLESKITLVGKIDRENIGLYYSLADFFYYTSKSETQGLIYWEALSFGLPIISVDSNVAREWVKREFGILTKNTISSMSSGVLAISKQDYDKLSENAIKFSKKYSSKKSAAKMISEYNKLLQL